MAQGQADCVFHKNSVYPSRAMSLAMHESLSTSSSSFSTISVLLRLLTSRNPCADSQEPRVTDTLIQNLAQIGQQANGQTKIRRLQQELARPRHALIQSQSTVGTRNQTKSVSQAGIQYSESENEFQDDLDSLQRSLEAPRDSIDS